jgi:glutaconyl-CoA/methylmalonyl-CoA decarboxylase subunit gamma
MRLTVVFGGKPVPVEVADDGSTVTVDGRTFPVRVVARTPVRVELEIAGEKSVVEEWPEPFAVPPTPVTVDGERWTVEVRLDSAGEAQRTATAAPAPPTASAPSTTASGAVPVLPPMPGRVVELRVKEGDRVRRGAVLLVLEAMKMLNEVTSPADGVVRDVKVAPGASVRAHDTMLSIAPS